MQCTCKVSYHLKKDKESKGRIWKSRPCPKKEVSSACRSGIPGLLGQSKKLAITSPPLYYLLSFTYVPVFLMTKWEISLPSLFYSSSFLFPSWVFTRYIKGIMIVQKTLCRRFAVLRKIVWKKDNTRGKTLPFLRYAFIFYEGLYFSAPQLSYFQVGARLKPILPCSQHQLPVSWLNPYLHKL